MVFLPEVYLNASGKGAGQCLNCFYSIEHRKARSARVISVRATGGRPPVRHIARLSKVVDFIVCKCQKMQNTVATLRAGSHPPQKSNAADLRGIAFLEPRDGNLNLAHVACTCNFLAGFRRHLRGKTENCPPCESVAKCFSYSPACGFSPAAKKSNAARLGGIAFLEQATGIEPASPAWEAGVLPLDYACERIYYSGWE